MIRMSASVNAASSLLPGTTPTHSSRQWEDYRIEWETEKRNFNTQIKDQVSTDYHRYGACSPTERFLWSIMNEESQTNSYQSANHICYKEVIINGKEIPSEILASKTITVPKQVVLENCMFLDFPAGFSFQFYHGRVHTGRLGINSKVILEKLYVASEEGGAPVSITIVNESKKPSFLSSLCGCCFGLQTSQNDYESLGEELPSPVCASDAVDFMSGSPQVPEGEPPSPIGTENALVYDDTHFNWALGSYQNSHGSANIGANSTTSTTSTTTVNTAQSKRGLRLLENMRKGSGYHPTFLDMVESHIKS